MDNVVLFIIGSIILFLWLKNLSSLNTINKNEEDSIEEFEEDSIEEFEEDAELVGKYSELLEDWRIVRPESDLPCSKERMRLALNRFKSTNDKMNEFLFDETDLKEKNINKSIETGLIYLDNFLSNEEYETVHKDIFDAWKDFEKGRDDRFQEKLKRLPEKYRIVFQYIYKVLLLKDKGPENN